MESALKLAIYPSVSERELLVEVIEKALRLLKSDASITAVRDLLDADDGEDIWTPLERFAETSKLLVVWADMESCPARSLFSFCGDELAHCTIELSHAEYVRYRLASASDKRAMLSYLTICMAHELMHVLLRLLRKQSWTPEKPRFQV
jgi:hypothetical protein